MFQCCVSPVYSRERVQQWGEQIRVVDATKHSRPSSSTMMREGLAANVEQ